MAKVEIKMGEIGGGGTPTPAQIYSKLASQTANVATTKAKLFNNTTTGGVSVNGTSVSLPSYTTKASWGNGFAFNVTDEFDLTINVGDTIAITNISSSLSAYSPVLVCYN